MIWLGSQRGDLTDWITQKWVQITGRRVNLAQHRWLTGPIGDTRGIGESYFETLASDEGLEIRQPDDAGLLRDSRLLRHGDGAPQLDPKVRDFYEHTAAYEFDAWGEWSGMFRPFGKLLALLFSRRLQQLNVPLSALDTSKGITSRVMQLVEPNGAIRYAAWVRKLVESDDVLYAGSYSVCSELPRYSGPCVKAVFPLPNGNAMVIMRSTVRPDGSLLLASSGSGFGDAGFYFTVHADGGRVWARYIRTFRETLHVYADEGAVRADHELSVWSLPFLRMHYKLARGVG